MKLKASQFKAPDKPAPPPSTPAPKEKQQESGPPQELLTAPKNAPTSSELEAEVLGSMILDEDVRDYGTQLLKPADFYGETHRRIYRAVATLAEEDGAMDLTLILDEMRRTPGFQGGDLATLIGVCDLWGTAAFGYQKIDRLKEYGDQRIIMRAAEEIATEATRKGSKAALAKLEALLPTLITVGGDVNRALDIAKRYATGQALVPTGFPSFDSKVGGIPRNDLTLICARSSVGKSQTLYPIANHIGMTQGLPFDIITPDAAISDILAAEAARRSSTSLESLRDPTTGRMLYLSTVDNLKNTFLKNVRLHQGAVDVEDIERIAKRAIRLGTSGIAVDTMNRVGYGREGKIGMLASLGTLLKDIAMEGDIPVIGLAQIRREVDERDDKRPTSADIADAPGSLYNDANMILFLYRDGRYYPTNAATEKFLVTVGKHKLGRAGVGINLAYMPSLAKVYDPHAGPSEKGIWDAPTQKTKPQAQVRPQPKREG